MATEPLYALRSLFAGIAACRHVDMLSCGLVQQASGSSRASDTESGRNALGNAVETVTMCRDFGNRERYRIRERLLRFIRLLCMTGTIRGPMVVAKLIDSAEYTIAIREMHSIHTRHIAVPALWPCPTWKSKTACSLPTRPDPFSTRSLPSVSSGNDCSAIATSCAEGSRCALHTRPRQRKRPFRVSARRRCCLHAGRVQRYACRRAWRPDC